VSLVYLTMLVCIVCGPPNWSGSLQIKHVHSGYDPFIIVCFIFPDLGFYFSNFLSCVCDSVESGFFHLPYSSHEIGFYFS